MGIKVDKNTEVIQNLDKSVTALAYRQDTVENYVTNNLVTKKNMKEFAKHNKLELTPAISS